MAQDFGFTSDSLIEVTFLGNHPVVTLPGVLLSNGTFQELENGTVLGKITASGKYTGYDPDATTGAEIAVTLLCGDMSVPATGDEKCVVYVHGEFFEGGLRWTHSGITDNEKATAITSLNSKTVFIKPEI